MLLEQQDTTVPCDLGDDLRLRYATVDDIVALAQWTREFASPSPRASGPEWVTLVEDTQTGQRHGVADLRYFAIPLRMTSRD